MRSPSCDADRSGVRWTFPAIRRAAARMSSIGIMGAEESKPRRAFRALRHQGRPRAPVRAPRVVGAGLVPARDNEDLTTTGGGRPKGRPYGTKADRGAPVPALPRADPQGSPVGLQAQLRPP